MTNLHMRGEPSSIEQATTWIRGIDKELRHAQKKLRLRGHVDHEGTDDWGARQRLWITTLQTRRAKIERWIARVETSREVVAS